MLDFFLEKVVRGQGEWGDTVAPEDKESAPPQKIQLLCSLCREGLSDISTYPTLGLQSSNVGISFWVCRTEVGV